MKKGTVNGHKRFATVFYILLALALVMTTSVRTAGAYSLSNTGVGISDIDSIFNLSGGGDLEASALEWSSFQYYFEGNQYSGTVYSGVFAEDSPDGTDDLFLYMYSIVYDEIPALDWINETDSYSPYRITGLDMKFGNLTGVDLNGDGTLETSYYQDDYGSGNWPNDGADYNNGEELSFSFFCCNIIDPGEASTNFGAVSTSSWVLADATLSTESGYEITVQVITAVPEPSTLLLLGTGLIGAAGLLRRRKKEVR